MNEEIVEYIRANRDRFTGEALRDELLTAGFAADAVDEALAVEGAQPVAIEPPSGVAGRHPRAVAAGIVVAAYGGMWLLFALATDWSRYYTAFTTQVLAGVLGLFGFISLIYIANTGRLTSGGRAAITGAVTVPIILLLILGGLCVPFTSFR